MRMATAANTSPDDRSISLNPLTGTSRITRRREEIASDLPGRIPRVGRIRRKATLSQPHDGPIECTGERFPTSCLVTLEGDAQRMRTWRFPRRDGRGQALIEYSLIIALITVVEFWSSPGGVGLRLGSSQPCDCRDTAW